MHPLAHIVALLSLLIASTAYGQSLPVPDTQSEFFEQGMLEKLGKQQSKPSQYAGRDFRAFVDRALGFSRARRSVSGVSRVGGLDRVDFRKPDLAVHFVSARKERSKLVIVVHGHRSSPTRALATMTAGGVTAFEALQDDGFDIVAPFVTSDPYRSTLINLRLTGKGIQIYGLWAAAICAYAEEVRDNYEKILLYGFSNGAIISGYTGALCGQLFSKVIIDDFMYDLALALNKVEQPAAYLYFYQTLGDFLRNHRFIDVMIHGSAPTFLIANMDYIERYFRRPLTSKGFRTTLGKRDVNFVHRPGKKHVRSIDILLAIAAEDYSRLKGWSMARP